MPSPKARLDQMWGQLQEWQDQGPHMPLAHHTPPHLPVYVPKPPSSHNGQDDNLAVLQATLSFSMASDRSQLQATSRLRRQSTQVLNNTSDQQN